MATTEVASACSSEIESTPPSKPTEMAGSSSLETETEASALMPPIAVNTCSSHARAANSIHLHKLPEADQWEAQRRGREQRREQG